MCGAEPDDPFGNATKLQDCCLNCDFMKGNSPIHATRPMGDERTHTDHVEAVR
jgi:hypothetical protein